MEEKSEILVQLGQLKGVGEHLKDALGHLEGIVKDGRDRQREENKDIRDLIKSSVQEIWEIINDSDTGFIVRIDRLIQESEKRKREDDDRKKEFVDHRKNRITIVSIAVANGIIILKFIWDYLTKKNG